MKRRLPIAGVMALIAGVICLLVYLRAVACGYVNFDDPLYIQDNPLIRRFDPEMLARAFTEPHLGWWMPLTWISFAVDYHFWELNPFGYHMTNIVLHAVNTGLVVLIADRLLKGSRGGEQDRRIYPFTLLLAGLLWGIHPLRVESVAWVTERKDVLNGLFTLSALLAYLCYVERKGSGNGGAWRPYLASLLLFACSLMAKSVSVVLPLMLLVMDWCPLGRSRERGAAALVREKLPFLVLSVSMAMITIYLAGDSSYLVNTEMFPWHERIIVSGNALLQYLRYLLWPAGITSYHMIPDPVPVASYTVVTVLMVALSGLLLWNARRRAWPWAAWLLFVIPLVPVLALLQNGDQSFAARFTYLPALAPSIVSAALAGFLLGGVKRPSPMLRGTLAVSCFLLLAGYAAMSYRLITTWDNGGTMWTRVIEHAPSSSAYWRRAMYYFSVGNHDAAISDYSTSIELASPVWRPHLHNLYAHRGEALAAAGRYEDAVRDLSTALSTYQHPLYFRLRGEALRALGRMGEAQADFLRAGNASGPLDLYFEPLPPDSGPVPKP